MKQGNQFYLQCQIYDNDNNLLDIKGVSKVQFIIGKYTKIYDGENNNVILDTKFVEIYDALEEDIKSITGVIESGLFMEYPIEVIH